MALDYAGLMQEHVALQARHVDLARRLAEKERAFRHAEEACEKMHESWGPLMARLFEAERLLRSVANVGYEENGTLFAEIDAFLEHTGRVSPATDRP